MTTLLLLLLAQTSTPTLNLNNQPLLCMDEGSYCRADRLRAFEVNCSGVGITCTQTGGRMTLSVSGGGGAPVDGGYVTFSGGTTGSTNERALTAGTNMTIDLTTPGQVILNASGGGAGNFVSDTVTFSAGKYDATRTVTAAWATPSSKILCVADGEEASVEGLVITVLTKASGSFVVRAEPRNGKHTGALPFTCTGN